VSIMAHAKENRIAITAADDSEAVPGQGVRGKVNGQEIVVGAAGVICRERSNILSTGVG
jgi:cation transport ATPase